MGNRTQSNRTQWFCYIRTVTSIPKSKSCVWAPSSQRPTWVFFFKFFIVYFLLYFFHYHLSPLHPLPPPPTLLPSEAHLILNAAFQFLQYRGTRMQQSCKITQLRCAKKSWVHFPCDCSFTSTPPSATSTLLDFSGIRGKAPLQYFHLFSSFTVFPFIQVCFSVNILFQSSTSHLGWLKSLSSGVNVFRQNIS